MSTNNGLKKHCCTHDVLYFTIIFSALNFFLIQFTSAGTFNPDGFLYLKTAKVFVSQGLFAAGDVYGWPFYSMLIGWLYQAGIPLLLAAQIINGILSIIISIAFVRLVKVLGGNRATQLFALLVILAFPLLNDEKERIARGLGYWPFALLAVSYLIEYAKSEKWRHAIAWMVTIFIAALFRVEALVLFALLPLFLLANLHKVTGSRIGYLVRPNLLALLGALVVAYYLIFKLAPNFLNQIQQGEQLSFSGLGRLSFILTNIFDGFQLMQQNFLMRAELFANVILKNLDGHPEWFAKSTLAGGLIFYFFRILLRALSIPFAILLVYGLWKKVIQIEYQKRIILIGVITINMLLLLYFVFANFFILERYMLFLTLILLAWVPFVLRRAHIYWQEKRHLSKKTWIFPLILIVIVIMMTLSTIDFKQRKAYIMQAAVWIKKNTTDNTRLLTNDAAILFYSKHQGKHYKLKEPEQITTFQKSYQNYDIVALNIPQKRAALFGVVNRKLPQLELLMETKNSRGDKVLIFRVKH